MPACPSSLHRRHGPQFSTRHPEDPPGRRRAGPAGAARAGTARPARTHSCRRTAAGLPPARHPHPGQFPGTVSRHRGDGLCATAVGGLHLPPPRLGQLCGRAPGAASAGCTPPAHRRAAARACHRRPQRPWRGDPGQRRGQRPAAGQGLRHRPARDAQLPPRHLGPPATPGPEGLPRPGAAAWRPAGCRAAAPGHRPLPEPGTRRQGARRPGAGAEQRAPGAVPVRAGAGRPRRADPARRPGLLWRAQGLRDGPAAGGARGRG